MKKMKLFLLAAMIFGAASAFTTVKSTETLWVLAPDGESYITEEDANLLGGECDHSFTTEKCTYSSEEGAPDPGADIGRYQY